MSPPAGSYDPVDGRPTLILGGHDFHSVTEVVAGVGEGPTPRGWWPVFLLSLGLVSFLGIGVAPPLPSWGNMIADARDSVRTAPWSVLAPGLAIGAVVTACAAVGDGLREALDPRRATRPAARRAPFPASWDPSSPMPAPSPDTPRSHA